MDLAMVMAKIAGWGFLKRFVTIAELKNRASEVLRRVRGGERVIVTRHGKPTALILPLDEDTIEEWALENNPALVAELEQAYRECLEGAGRPLSEVAPELQADTPARPRRRKRARKL